MSKTERSRAQFLELTRCGLWDKEVDLELFKEGVEWPELLQLAKEQTLLGVISTAIERLPLSLRPQRMDMLRLHQMVTLNRQYRVHQIEVLGELLKLMKRAGVDRPVLLKGLGVGLNYRDPSLRQCGDIDLYVGVTHYEAVWDFICRELNIPKEESHSDHHFDFEFMETSIEIHRYATAPNSVAFRREDFTAWATSQLEGDDLREVSIDGVSVLLPPHNFDFIFIFYHTWRHFLMGGVGLRQFCDWACYTDTFHEKFDRKELARLVKLFRLQRPISLFSAIAVESLGLDAAKFPNYVAISKELSASALERIWSRGNFGFYSEDQERKGKGFVVRKFMGLVATLRDMNYLMKIDSRYAVKFYSKLIVSRIQLAAKGV